MLPVYMRQQGVSSGYFPMIPSIDSTKNRLTRIIDNALPDRGNKALRDMAKEVIELSQHVKHDPTPTRLEAGIAADAVILLSNIIRRLDQTF
jgi:hypothetical protein